MQDYFRTISQALQSMLTGDEVFTASFSGEESDFVRMNHAAVRQAGHVAQRHLSIDLIEGDRHAAGEITLAQDLEIDRPRMEALVKQLREQRGQLPPDPYLNYATDVQSTERIGERKLPEAATAVDEIRTLAGDRDLVGLFATGSTHAGFANSLGQQNWQTTHSFNFEWSFYKQADKAVKNMYAGFEWEPAALRQRVDWAGEQLRALDAAPETIKPGRYRVYLAPAALQELVGIMCWGGFGLKSHRTKQTPLIKMVEAGARLHPGFTLAENTAEGVAPNFQEQGFLRPEQVKLINSGAFNECLVSPRSAREYGVPTNGANAWEVPTSLDLAVGSLPSDDVLKQLDTGVYVGNLWYLNYSDRNACRTTGMTRFATFWVQGGKIQGPLNVMRFDETIYRALGENLVGLTAEREWLLDPTTYGARSTDSARLPGALIEDFAFTL